MTAPAWTPGPWQLGGGPITNQRCVWGPGDPGTDARWICGQIVNCSDLEESEANARLISAAADFAEAAEPLVEEIASYGPSAGEDDDELVSVKLGDLRALRAALVKARGQ